MGGREKSKDSGKANAGGLTEKQATSFSMVLFPAFGCYWPVGKA